jgi:hypothetical protein
MKRTRSTVVPADLVRQIDAAAADLADARHRLALALAADAPLLELRAAHAEVRCAFDRAEGLLRSAAALAKGHSYREWSRWRHRVCDMSTQRVTHLFAEQDTSGLLPVGSVRAVDTGMTGPAIGDLLHGRSREPGAPATYGLDLEAVLTGAVETPTPDAPPAHEAIVIDLHPVRPGSAPDAA